VLVWDALLVEESKGGDGAGVEDEGAELATPTLPFPDLLEKSPEADPEEGCADAQGRNLLGRLQACLRLRLASAVRCVPVT